MDPGRAGELEGLRAGLRRWLPVLVVVPALAAAGWAAAGGTGLSTDRLPPPDQELSPQPPAATGAATAAPTGSATAGADPRSTAGLPDWFDSLLTAALLALFAGLVGALLYAAVRYLLTVRVDRRAIVDRAASQPPGADPAGAAEQVREAVRAGLADLAAGADPRRVVIACWVRLERLATAAGIPRSVADTPADLVSRLLAAHRVGAAPLHRLVEAYRSARYGPGEVSGEAAATARRALQDIDTQLAVAVPPEPRR